MKFRKRTVRELAVEVVAIARDGLRRRGHGEERHLAAIAEIAETGRTLADRMLEDYERKWGGKVDRAFSEYAY